MRKMKDSGIAWIGEIPEGWNCFRLKFALACHLQYGANASGVIYDEKLPRYIRITDIDEDGNLKNENKQSLPENESNGYILDDGDILLARSGATVGKSFLYRKEFGRSAFAGYLIRAKMNNNILENNFFYYITQTQVYDEWKNSIFIQATIQNIGAEKYANFYLMIPPLPEQQCITNYLDAKCAQIDATIASIHTLIDKLKEYKQSVITEAVTKGLDPDVPMKDSGVPWIGEIPEGWNAVRLKHICSKITDGSHFSPETTDDGYPYITAKDVKQRGIDYNSALKIPEEAFMDLVKSGCMPEKGDILLVKDGATTGRVGLMIDSTPCVVLSSVAMLHPQKNMLSVFLMYLIQSNILQEQISLSMAGSALPRVTIAKLVNYWGTIPPIQEQLRITSYLDTTCARIDAVLEDKQALLDKLAEYKKSLIFECVTGKREVAA